MARVNLDELLWIVIVKNAGEQDESTYIFTYTVETANELLKTLGRYAADPQLDFTWVDAARCSKQVRLAVSADEKAKKERHE